MWSVRASKKDWKRRALGDGIVAKQVHAAWKKEGLIMWRLKTYKYRHDLSSHNPRLRGIHRPRLNSVYQLP